MRVIVAHKIFIGSSIAAAGVLALTRILRYRHDGDPGTLGLAIAGLVAMPLLGLYLRRIWNR